MLKLLIRLREYRPYCRVVGRGHAARAQYDQDEAGHNNAAEDNQEILGTHLVYSIHRNARFRTAAIEKQSGCPDGFN